MLPIQAPSMRTWATRFPACVRHGDVHRLSNLGGFFLASFDHFLRVCQSNTHLNSLVINDN